jgi:hypothetical protein
VCPAALPTLKRDASPRRTPDSYQIAVAGFIDLFSSVVMEAQEPGELIRLCPLETSIATVPQ